MQHPTRSTWRAIALPLVFVASVAHAQGQITSPKEFFGHNIGDDYWLATYDQFQAYWQKLAKESDRMKLVEIGKSAEGRPQLMAIISSPENMRKLDRYKEISRRLASAGGSTTSRRVPWRRKARPSCGSTAACTPRKC